MRPLALVMLSSLAHAAAPNPLDLVVQDYTLSNGLRVVLSVDHAAPTVGVSVYFDAGSRVEAPGQSGCRTPVAWQCRGSLPRLR